MERYTGESRWRCCASTSGSRAGLCAARFLITRAPSPVPGPLRTARSGRPLSSPYRVRGDAFDLTKLHLDARASQRSDDDVISSAGISSLSSLIGQVGRHLEAHDQPPSNMPHPLSSVSTTPAPLGPPRSRRLRTPSPSHRSHPTPTLPRRCQVATQKEGEQDLTPRLPAPFALTAAARPPAVQADGRRLHATKREETEVKMCTQQDLILAYGLDSLDWTDITSACVLTPDDVYHCREGYEIGEVNVERCSVLEICGAYSFANFGCPNPKRLFENNPTVCFDFPCSI
ncbi:hypothetical protein EV715DRAFT_268628 [Schizophyllum commune]